MNVSRNLETLTRSQIYDRASAADKQALVAATEEKSRNANDQNLLPRVDPKVVSDELKKAATKKRMSALTSHQPYRLK